MLIKSSGRRRVRLVLLLAVGVLAFILAVGQVGRPDPRDATGGPHTGAFAVESAVGSGAEGMSPVAADGAELKVPFPVPPGQSPPGTAPDVVGDRDIVYTGSLTIRADDPLVELREATNVVKAAGGLVASSVTAMHDDGQVGVDFRVPSAQYESVLEQLSELGKLEGRTTSGNDVTANLADLEARLANAKSAVERMRALMAEANTVGEVIAVESQLTQRESEYEALKAQVESLSGAVQLATINMTIVGPEEATGGVGPGFMEGLRDGWEAVTATLNVIAVTIGFLLPLLPLAALVLLTGWGLRRRFGRRSSQSLEGANV